MRSAKPNLMFPPSIRPAMSMRVLYSRVHKCNYFSKRELKCSTHLHPEPLAGLQRPRAGEDVGAVVGDVVAVEVVQVEVERSSAFSAGFGPRRSRTPLCRRRHLGGDAAAGPRAANNTCAAVSVKRSALAAPPSFCSNASYQRPNINDSTYVMGRRRFRPVGRVAVEGFGRPLRCRLAFSIVKIDTL